MTTADIIARYRAGASLRTLATETGWPLSRVRRTLLRLGVELRPMGRRPGQPVGPYMTRARRKAARMAAEQEAVG